MATYEIEIRTTIQPLDVGPPGGPAMMANNLEVYNGKIGLIIPNDFPAEIPGGVINVDDTLIVRLINDLPAPIGTGIHWHGIELQSNADGTPVTQDAVPGGDLQVLGGIGGDPVGGTYLYKFKVTRPGIFWFHPHHFHSTNRVFRGTYGMIIVTDPNEATLIGTDTIPAAAQTEQIVLSDITVCEAPLPANNQGYDLNLPWAGPSGVLIEQIGLTPQDICDINAVGEDGLGIAGYFAGDVPNIQRASGGVNEGITVLTNGKNVGPRGGDPDNPAAIVLADVTMINVQPDQGLRLQIVNCATTRYFLLKLTDDSGSQVDLIRIGGEGGLLDNAVLEGGTITGFDTKYDAGEILIPPASRADVVVVIPDIASAVTDLTLWTLDFEGLPGQGGWVNLPTVPVLHLNVTGPAFVPAFTITGLTNGATGSTQLRSATGDLVDPLGAATANLLDPAAFASAKDGTPNHEIQLTRMGPGPSINNVPGDFSGFKPYSDADHLDSTRYAREGDLLHLTVFNDTDAHHPFHLHGFSFQPTSITGPGGALDWLYQEFRDTLDVPNGHTLAFKVQIEDARRFADDSLFNIGGSLGRWLFHCHIFFHAHRGMISELVITDPDGSGDEKPNIDVRGSWTYAPSGVAATRSGTYYLPDGDTLNTIVAHLDNGTPIGDITIVSATEWSWVSHTIPPALLAPTYVYVTITGNSGRKDQTVFRLKIGPPDDCSDNGDPHIHTVDGKTYHFQGGGEFTMLRDREGMEIQTRQRPVQTANPFKDSYSGLTSSVSVNTSVAARVGSHRISYQPSEEGGDSRLQFFLDGKPAQLSTEGIDLDGHRVSSFDADGETGLRVDYAHHAVLIVTPRFWNINKIWYMNVSVWHTQGNEGLMGNIPDSSWLPTLRSGATVGPMPAALHDRYIALYKTFANSWRVTDESSLFVYAPGTSTATFTDEDWPAEAPPSILKPQFKIPGATILPNIEIEKAEQICQAVTEDDLHADCVFDVVTTGDETFAEGYLVAQDLRLYGSTVQIVVDKGETPPGDSPRVTAIVLPMRSGGPTPTGTVTFLVDGVAAGTPVKLDEKGRASQTLDRLGAGAHKIRATFTSDDGEYSYHSSSSPNLLHTVEKDTDSGVGLAGRPWLFWLILIIILLFLIALIIIVING